MMTEKPLVSVAVITYNSAKTVIETLDSIYNQSYQNIELIISDDCSTDDTVSLCRKWLLDHKKRFVRTELICSETNTGISANFNRGFHACTGEWVKGIAGDDLLLPNSINTYLEYVDNHNDAICLFGRVRFFGKSDNDYSSYEEMFDYSFFSLPPSEQLHKLVYERNYIPAASTFLNLRKLRDFHLEKYDERIPFLEDWPKWIQLLQNNIRFHFIDRDLVEYRVNSGISNGGCVEKSYPFFRSFVQLVVFYQYPIWVKDDEEKGKEMLVDYICGIYNDEEKRLKSVLRSKAYRTGKKILMPFKWIKGLFQNKKTI